MGATIGQSQIGETAKRASSSDGASAGGESVRGAPQARQAARHGGSTALLQPVTRRRMLIGVLFLAAIAILVFAVTTGMGNLGAPDQPLIFYTVTRGDLPITVTERGNLESQDSIDIFCEVDDINGDGIHGTTILWIVANGSSVKKGDLLVELDRSGHQERMDRQVLDVEKARSEQIQAKAKYENRITQNETIEANARLDVELAKLEMEMFQDEEKGTHRLEVEAIKREIEDVDNQILAAQADLELKKNDMLGIEQLFKLGYAGKSELDRSRLAFLKAESTYAAEINKLSTKLATLEKKKDYERRMQQLKLDGAADTAERELQQALRDNEALLEQAKAAMEAADEAFEKEGELLTRYREALDQCEISAPADGMVAYAETESRYSQPIREGSAVRPRQKIITLPNLQKMQVRTAVHESVLDRVRCDLPATVRVDAFPELDYRGTVQSVAVLPDRGGWVSADTKTYKTIVTIDEDVEQLKPGMSAVVEIHVDRLKDVLKIPVQAVVQIESDTWCYVDLNGRTEQRLIELGRTNDKFVEIRSGLAEGERIVLNPMAILDESEGSKPEDSPEDEALESEGEEHLVAPPTVEMAPAPEAPVGDGADAASPSDRLRRRPESSENPRQRSGETPRRPRTQQDTNADAAGRS